MKRMPTIAVFGAALVAASAPAGLARGDGLPVEGIDVGQKGVVDSTRDARYVTLSAGGDTVLERVARRGGRVDASTQIDGAFTIPAVAYDATPAGLSADGRTLVLIRPRQRFPRATTPLVIVDARRLRVRRFVTLGGDFSFDALSPDGRTLYLVQYVSPSDPTKYAVRAYDVRAGRLVRAPIVDPRERGEEMRGSPITRVTSRDGQWAYTLYDGLGMPFVHALDTQHRAAHCIDLSLPPNPRRNLFALRLALGTGGGALAVNEGTRTVATIDTSSFRVIPPASSHGGGSGSWIWAVLALGAAALAAAAGSRALRRRRLAVRWRGTRGRAPV